MSESYYNIWNEQVQNKINAEIEKNRKSNAVLKFENLPLGSQIKVEQISPISCLEVIFFFLEIVEVLRKIRSMKTLSGICSMLLLSLSTGKR